MAANKKLSMKEKLALHKKQKSQERKSPEPQNRIENLSEILVDGADAASMLSDKARDEGRFIRLPGERFRADPNQPRKTFDEEKLSGLQHEIETIGQLQPIAVRPQGDDGQYEIIAGERRWRAICNSKKVSDIDAVIVTDELDELLVLRMQIQENDNRENVNAIENAAAILRGVELCKKKDANIGDKEAAQMLGVSPTSVSKNRALLKAPAEVRLLAENEITQDTDTLYELSKAYKKDPDATKNFISDMRNNDIEGNIRKAAKKLDTELKIKLHSESIVDKKDKEDKEDKKVTKKSDVTQLPKEPIEEKILFPEVESVTFGVEGNSKIICLLIDGESKSFLLKERAFENMSEHFNLELETES